MGKLHGAGRQWAFLAFLAIGALLVYLRAELDGCQHEVSCLHEPTCGPLRCRCNHGYNKLQDCM